MQPFQLEREHDAEEPDNEESESKHIDYVESSYQGLPQDDERADDGQDAESQVPTPPAGAVTSEVGGIAYGREPPEHEPESYDERNDFHADQGVGYEVDAENEVDDSSGHIPAPGGKVVPVAKGENDFDDTGDKHRDTENDAQCDVTAYGSEQ